MSAFKNKASSGGGDGDFESPPAGSHVGVLVALVDLGTQVENYNNQEKRARKLFFVWELTGEQNSKGENFIIGRDYTNSLHEKAAVRKIIEGYRGWAFGDDEEFDFTKMLDRPFLLTLVSKTSSNNRTYAKIESVGPLPKGMKPDPRKAPLFTWEVGDDPDKLPDWLPRVYGDTVRDKVMESEEVKAGGGAPVGAAPGANQDADDTEPF